MPHTISTIPIELLTEILSYLNIQSLKYLRQAIPCRRILTLTAQTLFQDFKIRLATSSGSIHRLGMLSAYKAPLSEPTEIDSGYGGVFANVKRFVLDTRYAVITNNYGRGFEAINLGRDFLKQELPALSGYVIRQQLEGMEVLLRAVETIVNTGQQLNEINWLTSGSLYPDIHQRLCSLLCTPRADRQYKLNVKLIVNSVTTLLHYCPHLSNLHRVTIRLIDNLDTRNIYTSLDTEHSQGLAQLILQSQHSLEHFMLDLRNIQTSPAAIRPLCRALEQATELRSLETYSHNGFTLDLDFTNLNKLEHLASVQPESWSLDDGKAGHQGLDDENSYQNKLLQQISNSGIRLKGICVMNYNHSIHGFFLRNKSDIEHIEIFGVEVQNQQLAEKFWKEVVPKYSATLKKLSVHFAEDNGTWTWKDEPGNLAKDALSKCRCLEALRICFNEVERQDDYLQQMITSLGRTCPKLAAIFIDFCGGGAELQASRARYKILNWRDNSPDKVFQNRVFDIVFETRSGPCAPENTSVLQMIRNIRAKLSGIYFTDQLAGYTGMRAMLYDTHIIFWRLPEPRSIGGSYHAWGFSFCESYYYDDGWGKTPWGAYEGFLQYR
ncbi:hypothetical protein TWF718_005387 [Orbilia javanica]|uniref:F-box domain-containing protein n=1 Tax=Orbilia javanica TaxID=47235 RepID=A0AAN8N3I3_9PEZI